MEISHRYGYWLRVVCVGLILAGGCASETEQLSQEGNWFESAKRDFGHLPNDVIRDSKDVFLRTDNAIALLLAGGASIAMHNSQADDKIVDNFDDHNILHGFTDESLNVIGSPGVHFAVAGLWYALSANSQDDFNKERAWVMIRALSVTGLVTISLKAVRDNDTPNGKRWAWPSGHTSSSFAAASVLDEFYGPKVGIPAYALASLVSYRMMDTGDHWASDIVFGATLGWVVGHTIAGEHKKLEVAGFTVLPYTVSNDGPVVGVNLLKRF